MFRIKICGVTSVADALAAVEAGADAIGLNFYERSPRFLDVPAAAEIASALPPAVARVGVFVNATAARMRDVCAAAKLTHLQLHGDEPVEMLQELAGTSMIKAFRLGPSGIEPITAWLDRCQELSALPAAFLVDAHAPGAYGGTGHTADWELAAQLARSRPGLPMLLAGGLTPENVAQAIASVSPAGVDTASGVEASPGKKVAGKMRAFVAAAREAFR